MKLQEGDHRPDKTGPDGPSFVSRLLRQELVVSVGCTEPAALALVAGAAASAARGTIRGIRIRADIGTFKNSLSVGLPGTDLRGPGVAAAAGALVADPDAGLQVLGAVTGDQWREAAALAEVPGRIEVTPEDRSDIRLEARVEGSESRGGALVEGRHDQIVWVRRDGKPLRPRTGDDTLTAASEIDDETIRTVLSSAEALLESLAGLETADLALVRRGIDMNRELARRGLEGDRGGSVGRAFRGLDTGHDPSISVKAWVSAGVEARMAGEMAPVMTSGGSGNSGITVSLGTWSAARTLGEWSDVEIDRATALAHLVNVAVKARIGRVGPLCGGAIASATGVGCGVAWLLGGRETALDRVIRHLVGATAGALCDGAKPACALKISGGLSVALDAARLAIRGDSRLGEGGLGGASSGQALERLRRLTREAFDRVDRDLLPILAGSEVP
ncbi:MAG: L-serine ammonia-lyase, iron-sulfur-dependent, subunit alpha [Thermoanaerobaculia bacterium]|nr:L-serine ammonia-lyase, iron-sulfur-dependent, subunit alpha [Thermoanaerobaculia bacterium]